MSRRLVPSTLPPNGATCFAPAFLRPGNTSLPRPKSSAVAAILLVPSDELKSPIRFSIGTFFTSSCPIACQQVAAKISTDTLNLFANSMMKLLLLGLPEGQDESGPTTFSYEQQLSRSSFHTISCLHPRDTS